MVMDNLELQGLAKANLLNDTKEKNKTMVVDVDCRPVYEIPQLDGLEDTGEFGSS